ncbi:hypothetical protein [Streptomyces cyaneofuscatus]|uniref:hypothetical protein n=1 Tax=Streptomyces cyaneofuscatus TaxID=66883 RepID=UPI00381167EF
MDIWIRFWTAVWLGWSILARHAIDLILCTGPYAKKPRPKPAKAKEGEAQPGEAQPGEASAKAGRLDGDEEADDSDSSVGARLILLGVTCGIVYGLPWTGYILTAAAIAWILTALVLGYIATKPPEQEGEQQEQEELADSDQEQEPDEATEEPPADTRHPSELLPLGHVATLLAEAYTEGSGVHLATLAERLSGTPLMGLPATPWKTADVRALLTRHGVRVRPGVRVPPVGGREGVHRQDFPPLPPPPSEPPVVGVVAPGQSNNNNGNAPRYSFEVVDDPVNPARARVHFPGR